MSVRRIKAGSTDVSVVIRIVDSTDGTPETGVVFNTSGIDLWYRRDLAASVDITEATLAALTTAHADGGFLHINDGWYRLDLPDAAVATGVAGVQIGGIVTGMVVLAPYIELDANTAADVKAVVDTILVDTDELQVDWVNGGRLDLIVDAILLDTGTTLDGRIPAALVSGRIDSSVGAMATNVLTATAINADAITAAKVAADVTTEIQTGLATAANLATVAGYLDTEIAAILADTNELQTDWANGGRLDLILDAASAPSAAAVADAVWDEVLADHLTSGTTGAGLNAAGAAGDPWSTALPGAYGAGSAGKIVGDNVNATISSRASQTSVDTVDNLLDTELAAVKTVVDAILVDTNVIGATGAGLTALATQTSVTTIDDLLDTELAAVKTVVDAILVDTAEIGAAGAGLTAIDLPNQTMDIVGSITGNLSGSVGSVTAAVTLPAIPTNWITAAGINADAITDAKVASDVTIASVTGAVGSVTGAVGSVTGAVGSIATGGIAAASFAAGAIDAAAIAANAIGASELAADAVAEIADGVWDEATSGHTTAATYGDKLGAHLPAVLKVIVGVGSTTTSIVLNATTGIDGAAPSSTNDFYNGRVVVFTSGALAGQATSISDYVGATVTLTVVALTGSAASAVTAVIV